LRIGIDVSGLVRAGSGAERFTRPLVEHLARECGPGDELVGFVNGRAIALDPIEGLPVVNPRWPWRLLRLAWDHGLWGVERFLGEVDVFYANDWICPPRLRRGGLVVTVFDLAFQRHPEAARAEDRALLERQLELWPRRAQGLIAISEATRADLMAALGRRCPPVRVVYPGLDPDLSGARDVSAEAEVRRRLGLPDVYALHLGTHIPRKNLPRLLRAYAAARRQGVVTPLVLIGGARGKDRKDVRDAGDGAHIEAEIERLGFDGTVIRTGHLPRSDAIHLLRGAKFFVFPSLYEGFGFPVLEAMACGVAVLASQASSIPEITGGHALHVDPASEEALAEGLVRLDRDESLRATLASEGPLRARQFSWARAARETLAFLRECVEPRP
jgi:glycosyltransferase involved in cell wall biosynthesis